MTFGRMRNYGDHLEVQRSPKETKTNYCVLVIYYPSLSRAIQWFDRLVDWLLVITSNPFTMNGLCHHNQKGGRVRILASIH